MDRRRVCVVESEIVHGPPRRSGGSEQLGGSGAAILTEWQASVTRLRKSSHLLNNTKNPDQISDDDGETYITNLGKATTYSARRLVL